MELAHELRLRGAHAWVHDEEDPGHRDHDSELVFRGLNSCDVIAMIVTPWYIRRAWTNIEYEHFAARKRSGRGETVFAIACGISELDILSQYRCDGVIPMGPAVRAAAADLMRRIEVRTQSYETPTSRSFRFGMCMRCRTPFERHAKICSGCNSRLLTPQDLPPGWPAILFVASAAVTGYWFDLSSATTATGMGGAWSIGCGVSAWVRGRGALGVFTREDLPGWSDFSSPTETLSIFAWGLGKEIGGDIAVGLYFLAVAAGFHAFHSVGDRLDNAVLWCSLTWPVLLWPVAALTYGTFSLTAFLGEWIGDYFDARRLRWYDVRFGSESFSAVRRRPRTFRDIRSIVHRMRPLLVDHRTYYVLVLAWFSCGWTAFLWATSESSPLVRGGAVAACSGLLVAVSVVAARAVALPLMRTVYVVFCVGRVGSAVGFAIALGLY